MINIDRCIISWPLLHSGWPKKQQGVRCKVVSGTLWKRHTNDSIHITLVNALQLGNLGKMSGNSRHHLSCSHIWMWRVQCWAGWIVLGLPGGVGTPLPLHADHHHIPTSKLYIALHCIASVHTAVQSMSIRSTQRAASGWQCANSGAGTVRGGGEL